jgi:hypothetical protein
MVCSNDPSVLRQSNGNDFNVEIIAEHRGMDNGFACRNPAPFGKGAKKDSATEDDSTPYYISISKKLR